MNTSPLNKITNAIVQEDIKKKDDQQKSVPVVEKALEEKPTSEKTSILQNAV